MNGRKVDRAARTISPYWHWFDSTCYSELPLSSVWFEILIVSAGRCEQCAWSLKLEACDAFKVASGCELARLCTADYYPYLSETTGPCCKMLLLSFRKLLRLCFDCQLSACWFTALSVRCLLNHRFPRLLAVQLPRSPDASFKQVNRLFCKLVFAPGCLRCCGSFHT